jgi:acetyl esterase/lipase
MRKTPLIILNFNEMKIIAITFILVCFACFVQAQDPYQKVYAQREIMRVDKNGNGQIEKSEANKRWDFYKEFDTNKDEVVSQDEYSTIEIPYLKTSGERKLNIKYKTTSEEDLYLDIYYSSQQAGNAALPFVIYAHGGGWFNGSKENITKAYVDETFTKLVEQGFAVISVNYRLTRFKSIVMKDCVVDVMDAVRYISKNGTSLNLDPNRVFVLGDSAGGQLAQMLTLASPLKFPGDSDLYEYQYKVVAGVSWYGPSDFTKIEMFETNDPTKNSDRFRGRILKPGTDPLQKDDMYKEMSPIYYLTVKSPPLYMMAAENDTTIPVVHAYHMKKYADEIGAPVELFTVKNAGHNWRKAGGEIDPSIDVIIQKTIDFLMKYK